MTVESAADRAAFLDADEFGVEGTYTPAGGFGSTVVGIFERPHLNRAFGNDGPALSDAEPTFTCRSIDLPVGAAGGDCGDRMAIGADNYRVIDLRPDGTGMTLITLGR